MSQGNTIQASFGVDLAPLKRDMTEAERIGRQGAANVATAMNAAAAQANRRATGFGNANPAGFGVPFGMSRSQRNSSSGFAPARAGQYPDPATEENASSRRIGRSVIGATMVYALRRAVNWWEELYDAELKIRDNVQKLTTISGSGRTSGQIVGNVSGIASQIKEIEDRTRIETKQAPGSASDYLGRAARAARQKLTGDSDEQEAERLGELRTKAKSDLIDLAKNQEDLNRADKLSADGKEKEAELLKEEVRLREKLRALSELEVSVGQFGQTPADRALLDESKNNVDAINRKAGDVISRFNQRRNAGIAEQDKEEFNTFQAANGDWSGYKQEQRDQKHARAVFDARKADFESRRARGAYGQSGPDAEAFGMSDSMDGWDKVVAVMREVWGKN